MDPTRPGPAGARPRFPAQVVMPLPDRDFDTTEAAVPWALLEEAGHQVVFATEAGRAAPACDPRLLTGVLFGKLGAATEPRALYTRMVQSPAFQAPIPWSAMDPAVQNGLWLAGGHAPGMRQYLGSEALQRQVARFWALGRPVAAICHGVLVLARARDSGTGRSLLAERRTTCLPAWMERSAWGLTAWKLGRYYRTYDETVEHEVRAALADPDRQFHRGPLSLRHGTRQDDGPAFVVEDGPYVSARWPGDAWALARAFLVRLERPATDPEPGLG